MYEIFEGAGGSKFVGEIGFGEIVAEISKRAGVRINSHARDAAAEPLLHRIGLHSQAEVIRLHAQGVPGYGPANPVNKSTHCRYNDGVAYRWWPPFFRIPTWARGIDTANSPEFCKEAAKLGYVATVTYPGSIGEAQHVNFRKAPHKLSLWVTRPLRVGDGGPRARLVIRMLRKIESPKNHKPYLDSRVPTKGRITDHVAQAVRRFQRDHNQKPDGLVGAQTRAQLGKSYRYWRKRK